MTKELKETIQKAFEEVKKEYPEIVLELKEDEFKILYKGKALVWANTWWRQDKIEMFDPFSRKHKWVKSFKKIKELMEDGVYYEIRFYKKKEIFEQVVEQLKTNKFINENFEIYCNSDNIVLSPKNYQKGFKIIVKYWEDEGLKTYLTITSSEMTINELDKLDIAKEEFKKVSEIVRNLKCAK